MSQAIANFEKGDMPEIHTKASCFKLSTLFFFNIISNFGH